ncbi:T9SS type A sorting domain-containing protein [uncultured Aquimarina sp.]|uniref:T9SS type A sorting domain-containing protein n=1 Tax=uncultured Aquimarina sp. TaxID=575652 RepID=UPI002601A8A8|nr:T9SS type A sorting domain-containing protein [uncultured Aquimarina sp.]
MIRKFICVSVSLLFTVVVFGQVTNELPKSSEVQFSKTLDNVEIPSVKMASIDLEALKKEDAINDQDKSKVYRFGHEFKVDLGIANAGVWTELPNGDRIWRIRIISEGANTLNFVFNSFRLPEGGKVFLYNEDKSFHLGAYTDKMNNPDETIGTWLADGDNIIIEYYEPKLVRGLGKLNIGSVVHGYRSKSNFQAFQKGLNTSGDCNQDVNCPVGSDFDSIKDIVKKAVGIILVGTNGFCTGTLINNTSRDGAPYFLTANHCGTANPNWAFRFNWISTNAVCATTEDSVDNGPSNYFQTTSGATPLAVNPESDVQLVEITGGLDQDWDIEWAGWDRTGNTPDFVVGIHHPDGDIMKVCREDISPTIADNVNIGGIPDPVDTWRVDDWDLGVTEGGSSGSAIFDPQGRIVGQLAGGGAACSGTDDNGAPDFYGRFSISWDFGTTDATRLSNWLDPTNTGQTALNALSQGNDPDPGEGGEPSTEIVLYPNPTEGMITISEEESTFDYLVFDIFGQVVARGQITNERTIDLSSIASGMYFVYMENLSEGGDFTKKIIVE